MAISLNLASIFFIEPLVVLLIGALLILLLETFFPEKAKKSSENVALLFLLLSSFFNLFTVTSNNPLLTPWITYDLIGTYFSQGILLVGIASIFLGKAFFKNFEASQGEYYFLLLTAIMGLILIGRAADFLTLFLGIETLSLSLYVLTGYMKNWTFSSESALKYFFMGSLAAAFLLYGIALIYGAIGTTSLESLGPQFKSLTTTSSKWLFYTGIAFVTVGLAFEAAIFPFHLWAPDVYQGAPTPVTAFMSVGTKLGAFAAFAKIFLIALPNFDEYWKEIIFVLAIASITYGSFLAIRQNNLRRFFAYSGIGNAGFLLLPIAAGGPLAIDALIFYLFIYSLGTLGCFAAIAYLDKEEKGVGADDLFGLFGRSKWVFALFSLSLLTLGGLPPTPGFFAKFYIFKVAIDAGFYWPVVIALFVSIISIFYYLRLIVNMSLEGKNIEIKNISSATILGAVIILLIVTFSLIP